MGRIFVGVIIIGEYNVAYCSPFSGIDAHPPRAINHTENSAHSEQLFISILPSAHPVIHSRPATDRAIPAAAAPAWNRPSSVIEWTSLKTRFINVIFRFPVS